MQFITLNQLLNFMWYSQKISVIDEFGNILYEGETFKAASDSRIKSQFGRYVKSYGVMAETFVIKLI